MRMRTAISTHIMNITTEQGIYDMIHMGLTTTNRVLV